MSIPTMIAFYYTLVMAWAFYYMFMGFRSDLPWQSCVSSTMMNFSTTFCYSKYDNDRCVKDFNTTEVTFFNKSCIMKSDFCNVNNAGDYEADTDVCVDDAGYTTDIPQVVTRITPSEEFFNRRMYGQTVIGVENTWENWGNPQWEMIGCLALCWIIIALSLIKGVQSYGKLSYFVTLFPYVILTVFLIMMSLEKGFSNGINNFYMKADWSRLGDIDVWVDACTQIFFSLSVGVGAQLLLCSYNKVCSKSIE